MNGLAAAAAIRTLFVSLTPPRVCVGVRAIFGGFVCDEGSTDEFEDTFCAQLGAWREKEEGKKGEENVREGAKKNGGCVSSYVNSL